MKYYLKIDHHSQFFVSKTDVTIYLSERIPGTKLSSASMCIYFTIGDNIIQNSVIFKDINRTNNPSWAALKNKIKTDYDSNTYITNTPIYKQFIKTCVTDVKKRNTRYLKKIMRLKAEYNVIL